MFRPQIDWQEDGIDYRRTGYLPLIENATAMLRALTEWLAELDRKEAVRLDKKEEKIKRNTPMMRDVWELERMRRLKEEGHSSYCACGIVWGAGECTCKKDVYRETIGIGGYK